jgi:hypothetical protein
MPTINVQALSAGAVAVDAFAPDFTNPACTVFTNGSSGAWGRTPGEKYIAANTSTNYTALTTAEYRDVEVTTWMRKSEIFLALTDDGRGLRVTINEDTPSIALHPLQGIADPPGAYAGEGNNTTFDDRYGWNMTTFTGWSANSGQSWTVGLEGIEFYIKHGSTEVVRVTNPYQLRAGKVGFKAINNSSGGYGFHDMTVTALAPVSLYSDPDTDTYDPRDYGFKDIATTGSITSGTPTLVVADATGYEIGDPIIVEIGDEPGAGLRGTVGVGGTWPAMSYANQAAMDADTTQVDGQWAYAADTGLTKWWDDDATQAWSRSTRKPSDYYESKCLPLALIANITNIVGNTITLDTNASATATDANVYYNCLEGLRFWTVLDVDWNTAGRIMTIPAGDYAVNGLLSMNTNDDTNSPWEIYGQGIDQTRIFSPDGAACCGIHFVQCGTSSLHDLEVCGNFGDNGYFFTFYSGNEDEISRNSPGFNYGMGVDFYATNGTCYNVRSGQHGSNCFHAQYVSNLSFTNCHAFQESSSKIYLSWCYQVADSDAATPGSINFTDCSYTCPEYKAGFETFRSNGVHFIRFTSVNGQFSSNSSGNFFLDDCSITMTALNQKASYTTDYGEAYTPPQTSNAPLIDINSNIQPPSAAMLLGGLIRNPTLIVEGYSTVGGNGYRGLITPNNNNPNISIIADPPWTERPCNAPLQGGYFSVVDYSTVGTNVGGLAVNTGGDNTLVDGIRVNGVPNFQKNVSINANSTGSIVRNCVFDVGVSGTATQSGNITVAEWAVICENFITHSPDTSKSNLFISWL